MTSYLIPPEPRPPADASTDISGRLIPAERAATQTAAGVLRQIAVPPVLSAPNEQAIEFTWSAAGTIPANTAAFTTINDATNGTNQFPQTPIDQAYRGRISSVNVFVPDMVAAANAYIFFRLINLNAGGATIAGWDSVAIFPRAGTASVSFDSNILLPPGAWPNVQIRNTDAVNAHFVGVYLYGWLWPVNLAQA